MKQIKQYIKNEKILQTSVVFCLFGGYHRIAANSPAKKIKPTVSDMVKVAVKNLNEHESASYQKVFGNILRS
jgi:hypothetical protein